MPSNQVVYKTTTRVAISMLLRLIPNGQLLPSVTFKVAFKQGLPDGVGIPQGWASQLHIVLQDDLEAPECIHALDKAAWGVSLLQEVTFNVALRIINCTFVDGTRLDWPMLDRGCLHTLYSVLDKINSSFLAAEQERETEYAREVASQPVLPRSVSPVKPSKHKRSRSFLMSLVA